MTDSGINFKVCYWIIFVIFSTLPSGACSDEPYISEIQPRHIGRFGAGKLWVFGGNFDSPNPGENEITLVSSSRSYPCNFLKEGSTDEKLACYSVEMEIDTYHVRVRVRGVDVHNKRICNNRPTAYSCRVYVQKWLSPYIYNILPRSGPAGGETLLKMRGVFYTDAYGSNTVNTRPHKDHEGIDIKFTRGIAGSQECRIQADLLKVDNEHTDWGYAYCKVMGNEIGGVNISLIESGGRGRTGPYSKASGETWDNILRINAIGKIEMFQQYAEVVSVSPSVGSTQGGTKITVVGRNFDNTNTSPIAISIEGVPCKVTSFDISKVECITGPKPAASDYDGFYQGNRGSTIYMMQQSMGWTGVDKLANTTFYPITSAVFSNWTDGMDWCETTADDFACPFNYGDYYGTLTESYFVAPFTGRYKFYIKGDDIVQLYFSKEGAEKHKKMIAYTTRYCKNFQIQESQKSEVFQLVKNKRYYMSVAHMDGYSYGRVSVAVAFYDLPEYTSETVKDVYEEKQTLKVTSTRKMEVQTVVFDGIQSQSGKSSVQKVTVTTTDVANTFFRLCVYGLCTAKFTSDKRESELKAQLNGLPLDLAVSSLKRSGTNEKAVFTITFAAFCGRVPKITYETEKAAGSKGSISVSVEVLTEGELPGSSVSLQMGGKAFSDPISITASADAFKDKLKALFKSRCASDVASSRDTIYFEDFEGSNPKKHYGSVRDDEEPLCGEKSVRKPGYILRHESKKVTTHHLCFGHKFPVGEVVELQFNGGTKESLAAGTGDWQYTCLPIINTVYKENPPSSYTLKDVRVIRKEFLKGAFFFDQISVSAEPRTTLDLSKFRIPPRALVKDIDINKTSTNPATYIVTLDPLLCANNFQLFSTKFGQVKSGSLTSSNVQTADKGWSSGRVKTSRQSSATGPVNGHFTITVNGKELKVTVGMYASDLKADISSLMDDKIDVKKTVDTCHSQSWEVEWKFPGGDRPTMTISKKSLSGNEVDAVNDEKDGFIFINPITGDFLRTVHRNETQVSVLVNGLPTKCSGDCAYSYSEAHTPTLTGITPSRRRKRAAQPGCSNGAELVIDGTGFDGSNVTNNEVMLDDIPCVVTAATNTKLTCTIGDGSEGTKNLQVSVAGKGLSSGSHTYEYKLCVTGISPKEGSIGGGLPITISGAGFSSQSSVQVGSKNCSITTVTPTSLVCTSPEVASGATESVTVFNGASNATCGDCQFTYKSLKTPVIDAISVVSSSVVGGGTINITGSGLGSSSSTTSVRICKKTVVPSSVSDSTVIATIPPNSVGCCDVKVFVDGKGDGDLTTNSISQLCYKLTVTDVTPLEGSNEGGTLLTLTGEGFGTNESLVSVMVGKTPCSVQSLTDNQTVCSTGSGFKVHSVTHLGIDPDYGIGYAWSQPRLTIQVGDYVEWTWAVQDFVTGLKYAVEQTSTAAASEYDGSGFKSETSAKGSFKHQFLSTGTYYYWSGDVATGSAVIIMRGVITVEARTDFAAPVTMKVDNHEAEYNKGGSASADNSGCPGGSYKVSGCSSSKPTGTDSSKFNFAYWMCKTPSVSSVSRTNATSEDEIVIKGKGFASKNCQNEVKFGDTSCTVTSSGSSEIKCKLDTSAAIKAFSEGTLSLRVGNTGYATSDASLTLLPHISGVSPATGSLNGGTSVTISGHGLTYADVQPLFPAPSQCELVSTTYTQTVCKTKVPYKLSDTDGTVQLSAGGKAFPCDPSCDFSFKSTSTPTVSAISPDRSTGPLMLNISGSNFGTDPAKATVLLDEVSCNVTSISDTLIQCSSSNLEHGNNYVKVHIAGKGKSNSNFYVYSKRVVDSVTPVNGSTAGGTLVLIKGNGFRTGSTSVTIGNKDCPITQFSFSSIQCRAPPGTAGVANLIVRSSNKNFETKNFEYSDGETPTLTSVSPTSGEGGQEITLAGNDFGSTVEVTINSSPCKQTSLTNTEIKCKVGPNPSGSYDVQVYVDNKGYAKASSPVQFSYVLTASSITPNTGSQCGGNTLTIAGSGFVVNQTNVTICEEECKIMAVTPSQIKCLTAASNGTSTVDCDVVITVDGKSVTSSTKYKYTSSVTPVVTKVEPSMGGTAGGTVVTITGSGFSLTKANNVIDIGGSPCIVSSATDKKIICTTEKRTPSASGFRTFVVVENTASGKSCKGPAAEYFYIDRWSSPFTWGGAKVPLPSKDDIVVIPSGQVVMLDNATETPILKVLVIEGALVFEDPGVDKQGPKLNAINILINKGGLLQIGTEDVPYEGNAEIMLHGHQRTKEIPVYGTKNLGVRNGTLDLHGKPVAKTWVLLAATASAGTNTITLKTAVTWKVGDMIVLPTTGHRHTQSENEVRTITAVSGDGKTLTLDKNLDHTHLGETRTFGDRTLELRGEVGLLTHNVKVRGSEHAEWNDKIEACPDGFNTGEFVTQTCFQGRFGAEMGSDEFGGHIMVHPAAPNKNTAVARISYIELTYVGQAFRLGRYPVHFHLVGNVLKPDGKPASYVKGCGIHRTFNRAVNVHGTHNLMVEHNVVYNVMGGALFLEDGIETGNTFQYNLAVFVKASSSLLNDDITPAAYWITNPNNTIRFNHAAGGTHFGFWYRMHTHPDGPSFDPNIFPRCVPLGAFHDNTVHSQGWFGVWIFQDYYPMKDGKCSTNVHVPALFNTLTTWHCEKGAEYVNAGAMTFANGLHYCNSRAGIEGKLVVKRTAKVLIVNTTFAACEFNKERNSKDENAVVLPWSDGQYLDSNVFVNYNENNTAVIAATRIDGTCGFKCGGFDAFFKNSKFISSDKRAVCNWDHETVLNDQDGSLHKLSTPGSRILPCMNTLPMDKCKEVPEYSTDVKMCLCEPSVSVSRFAANKMEPDECNYKNLVTSNKYGNNSAMWLVKRLTHKEGWMMDVVMKEENLLTFENCKPFNISYEARVTRVAASEWVILCHTMALTPDRVFILKGQTKATDMSTAPLTFDKNKNGDWTYNPETRKFCYILSGKQPEGQSGVEPIDIDIKFSAFRCYYPKCLPPPDPNTLPPSRERPANAIDFADFVKTDGPFRDGEDLLIPKGKWIVKYPADNLPKMKMLRIEGTLEMDDSGDHTLQAENILLLGRMVAGWQDNRFKNKVDITTNGQDYDTPLEQTLNVVKSNRRKRSDPAYRGPPLGSNLIAVFGGLDLYGVPKTPQYSHLASTISAGDKTITLKDPVEWAVGDEIAIAATSFNPDQSEKKTIASISEDKKTLTLTEAVTYRHIGSSAKFEKDYYMAAEVSVLSRNIKIQSDATHTKGFGTRLLVSSMSLEDGGSSTNYIGYARLENVAFYQTGQEGFTANYDPRFTVAFLNPGQVDGIRPSSVEGISCVDTYSPCVGAFGADKLKIRGNNIFGTIGGAIRVESDSVEISSNVIMNDVWPGGWNGRFEVTSLAYDAAIEAMVKASNVILANNVVAGAERIGYHVRPPTCDQQSTWQGNVVHSSTTGVIVIPEDQLPGSCVKFSGFFAYKSIDYGFYYQSSPSLEVHDMVLAENSVSFFAFVLGPGALSHVCANKYVSFKKSTVVGTSEGFDCTTDKINWNMKMLKVSGVARSGNYKNDKGSVGLFFPSFQGAGNSMPFKPWKNIMAYPAICGKVEVSGVTFRNFSTNNCGLKDTVITSNPSNDDFMHPVRMNNITCSNIQRPLKFSRSSVGKVNPSDCVDMICDAKKELMIDDEDGTFSKCISGSSSGSSIAYISKAEDEWDGDKRWGVGDYRIPKTMLTDAKTGARLDVNKLYPNKGHYRGNPSQCVYNSEWHAYKCTGINYRAAVIESMDSDTETRRLSPVALATGGYIDLINGPQDHGWCAGYTCQKRISTFQFLMAMNQSYDVYFTGVSPQKLRFFLLNAAKTDAVRVAIFYSTPLRLDVYTKTYMYPTNSNAKGTLEDPTYTGQYLPKFDMPSGSNWFDRETNLLHIIIKGDSVVDIKAKEVVVLSVNLPPITVDDFFGENLVNNLATFLGVPANKIRIVNVVRENGRRKRSTGSTAVQIEIGDPPSDKVGYNETAPDAMSYESLVNASAAIINAVQLGKIDQALNTTVLDVNVVEPLPDPSNPLWNELVKNDNGNLQISVQIPASMQLVAQPVGVQEGSPLSVQPSLQVYDSKGTVVKVLGSNLSPWMLTAELRANSGSDNRAKLMGTTTIPYKNGWFNFTDLFISHSGSGYIIDFTISSPAEAIGKFSANSPAISVAEQQLKVGVLPMESNITVNDPTTITVEIQDLLSGNKHHNIAWKGHTWKATASLSSPNVYNGGAITGTTTVTVNPSTSQAIFSDITFTAAARYYMTFSVQSTPSKYSVTGESAAIDVTPTQCGVAVVEVNKTVTVKFNADFGKVTGKYVTALVMNHIKKSFCDVIISNPVVTEGSVVVSFVMSGNTSRVDSAISSLANDIKGGLKLNYGSLTFEAQPFMKVDGSYYSGLTGTTTPDPPKPKPKPKSNMLGAIIGGAVGGVVLLVLVAVLIIWLSKRNGKRVGSDPNVNLSSPEKQGTASSSSMDSFRANSGRDCHKEGV